MHPEIGNTQITFDQFISITKHHQDIRTGSTTMNDDEPINLVNINKLETNNLTQSKLIRQKDWEEREAAEKQQMDLYET